MDRPGSEPRHGLHGLIASVHTPFSAHGRFRGATVVRQHELLVEGSADGVFLCGTAGEGQSLTVAERRALLDTWVGVTDGALPLIAQVGHNCVRDAVELAGHANSAGAIAIAVMAPSSYPPLVLEDLIEYLALIAEAAPDLPLLYYYAPEFNGVDFPADKILEWGRLRIPSLRGVVYAGPDIDGFERCVRLDRGLDVLIAREELLLPALTCGADGAVAVTLNYATPGCRRLLAAFERGDLEAARAEEASLGALTRVLREYGPVRASKALMQLLRVDCGDVRLPLRPLADAELRALHEQVKSLGVFPRYLSTPAEIGR